MLNVTDTTLIVAMLPHVFDTFLLSNAGVHLTL